ncbi:MAG: hypothetical protein WBD31_25595 [Rubripirellula sp.]
MTPIDTVLSSRRLPLAIAAALLLSGAPAIAAAPMSAEDALAAVSSVSPDAAGLSKATAAVTTLRQLPADRLPELLDAMAGADPVSRNWIRGIAFDIKRRTAASPTDMLEDYAMDRSKNMFGRGLAMEMFQLDAPERASQRIDECLDDPGLPLRQMAVAQVISRAEQAKKDGDEAAAKSLYAQALVSARQPRQLESAVSALKGLGEPASIAKAFGMIMPWKAIGPFDNVGGVGFDTAYSVEKEYAKTATVEFNPAADGKDGEVVWQDITADDDSGNVDLAAAFNKEKGATAYVYTTFQSPTAQTAQARLGSIAANKVWINGNELIANKIYHSGTALDQYIAQVELKAGENTILIKNCQNEQTEGWAQDWGFQFRLTDLNGKGLISGN